MPITYINQAKIPAPKPCKCTTAQRLMTANNVVIVRALFLLATILSNQGALLANFTFLLVLNQINAAIKIIAKIMLYISDR